MKRYIILLLILSILTACVAVEFKNPQPKNGKILTEFPKEFMGIYFSSKNDTFVIANTYFKAASVTIKTIDNPKDSEIINLSENVILKKIRNYFILNMKDKGNWGIVILNKSSKGLIIQTFNANDQEFLTTLKTITKTEEIRNEGKLKRIILDPSDKEFKKIMATQSLFEKSELTKIK